MQLSGVIVGFHFTFAWSKDTALFEVRSDLLPTSSLFTFSEAYLEKMKGEWLRGWNWLMELTT